MQHLNSILLATLALLVANSAHAETAISSMQMNLPQARQSLCELGVGRACDIAQMARKCRMGKLSICLSWHREIGSQQKGDPILAMLVRD